jgi:hypothetical protein
LCLFAFWAFQRLTKYFAQRTCWLPIPAAGPVYGAAMPIVRVLPHVMAAADTDSALLGALLGDLIDPRAAVARTATPAANSAATTNFLMFPSY